MPRAWKPGGGNYGSRGAPRIADTTVAWVKTVLGQFSMVRYPNDTEPEEEDQLDEFQSDLRTPTYLLVIPRRYGRPTHINLTSFTEEELDAVEHMFTEAFKLARPIVQFKDKEAADAEQHGDFSIARIYRVAPQVVERTGSLREDDQGVLHGLEGALARRWDEVDPDERPGADQPGVASVDAQDRLPGDDAAQAD